MLPATAVSFVLGAPSPPCAQNDAVLASRGRLHPIPSPSVFGGRLPDPTARGAAAAPPSDPRLAVNALHQLPWQVAYAAHLRALAELLHPSMPLAFYFPAPAVGTLQALAAAALRQQLASTLDAAQQADEARQRRRLRRLAARPQHPQQQQHQVEDAGQRQEVPCLQRRHSSGGGGGASSSAASECGAVVVAAAPRPAPRSAPVGAAGSAGCSRRSEAGVDAGGGVAAAEEEELAEEELALPLPPARPPPSRSQALALLGGDSPANEARAPRLAVALAQLPRDLCVKSVAGPPLLLPMPNKKQAADDEEDEDEDVHVATFAHLHHHHHHDHHHHCGGDARCSEEGEHAPCAGWGASADVNEAAAVQRYASFGAEEDEQDEEEGGAVECAVCLDAEARMLVVPCRHCLCAACSRELVRAMGARPLGCPLCRTNVQGFALAAGALA